MIIYNVYNGHRLLFLCHVTGSTLFSIHTLPFALLSGALALFFGWFAPVRQWLEAEVEHPNVYLGPFNFLAGFLIVYRSQLAITRYREALSAYTQMSTKVSKGFGLIAEGFIYA